MVMRSSYGNKLSEEESLYRDLLERGEQVLKFLILIMLRRWLLLLLLGLLLLLKIFIVVLRILFLRLDFERFLFKNLCGII